ncbi:MAG: RIP metalloprotease, partial [Chitinophagia bacterium]|nr:RIP metalloprotease [Chitinophagia bacterium]
MWVTIAQFLLSLSILIVLHEFGHFGAAKWFKTRVEKFYLFFNPGFSLFKFQKGETEYGLGWLPLGGYVKISGMIDESFDKEQMKEEPKPWEFRSKPAWQRLIIMVGGVTVNFILGIILFAMILFVWGELYISNEAVTEGIAVSVTGYEMGLRDGDKILSVGDKEFEQFRPGV